MLELRPLGAGDIPWPLENEVRFDAVPGHPGLILDKLGGQLADDKINKRETLSRLFGHEIERNSKTSPNVDRHPFKHRILPKAEAARLKYWHQRMDRLAARHESQPLRLRLTSPLVIGIGQPSPLETGCTIHHSLGVPFIPGSAVKGALRAYYRLWPGFDEKLFASEFGDGGDANARKGAWTLLDALPSIEAGGHCLAQDVMTPHAGPYYERAEPPADWHSPVPIFFLIAPAGTEFVFRILPAQHNLASAAARDAIREDLADLLAELANCLEMVGIGAKTAAGYGRFTKVT